jgi:hypothetical protein
LKLKVVERPVEYPTKLQLVTSSSSKMAGEPGLTIPQSIFCAGAQFIADAHGRK